MVFDNGARVGKYDNLGNVEEAFSNMSATYVDTSLGSSTDPFASKTNKYAETSLVRITAKAKAIWVRWSAAGTAAAANTDNNFYIPAENSRVFMVETSLRYLRIIEDAASATSIVEELA